MHDLAKGFALGFGAHLIFDVITYALAIGVGIRIGHHKHKH